MYACQGWENLEVQSRVFQILERLAELGKNEDVWFLKAGDAGSLQFLSMHESSARSETHAWSLKKVSSRSVAHRWLRTSEFSRHTVISERAVYGQTFIHQNQSVKTSN